MKLQEWCKQEGYNSRALSTMLGCSYNYAYRLITGSRKPARETMAKIHAITDGKVTLQDFAEFKPESAD